MSINPIRLRRALPVLLLGAVRAAAQDPAAASGHTLRQIEIVGQAVDGTGAVIARDTLQRHQATDMADLFANQASMSVGGGAGHAKRIYLRGIDGSNLNVSIDGAQQGRPLHQHLGNTVGLEPELLKHVEVQPGQSAEVGPGALGGSIRLETVDAQDMLARGRTLGATVRAAWLSADDTARGGATVYGLAGARVGLLAHAGAARREDYRIGGGGRVPGSGGQDRDYLLKLSMLDAAGHSLRASAAHDESTGLYMFSRVGSDIGYAPPGTAPTRQRTARTSYSLQQRYRPAGNALVDIKTSLYVSEQRMMELDATPRGANSRRKGGSLRNTAGFTLAGLRQRLTAGLDFYDEEGVTTGQMGPAILGSGRRTTGARNLGLFAQDRLHWERLMLSLGLRHERYQTQYGPYTLKGSANAPNANLELDLDKGFTLSAGYGEAVRASGALTIGFLASLDARTNFNDGKPLQPESSRMRDAGVSYEGMLGNARVNARVARFDTRIANLIEWPDDAPVRDMLSTYVRNMHGQLRSRGWEVRAGWQAGTLDSTLALLLADTTVDGKPVSPQRRVGATLGDRLSWDIRWQAAPGLAAGYTLNAVRRLDDLPAGAAARPGYAIHAVQLQWQPAAARGLKLALALRNLADKRYVSHSSLDGGIGNILPEPGRDLRAMLSWQH